MAKTKGHVMDCPLCGEPDGAQVGASKKGYAYAVCDNCGMQLFTRSRFAHERLMSQCATCEPGADAPAAEPDAKRAPPPAPVQPADDGGADDWLI